MTESPRLVRPIHLLAFAFWPPVALYMKHLDETPIVDALVATALVLIGAILLGAVLTLVTRRLLLGALLASVLVLAFFLYDAAYESVCLLSDRTALASVLGSPPRRRVVLVVLGVPLAFVGLLVFLARRRLTAVTRFLNIVSVVLLVVACVPGLGMIGGSSRTGSGGGSGGGEASPVSAGRATDPDIYFIILDRYPNTAVLRERYAHHNYAFLESLRSRGFSVSEEACSNYARSCLSIAATLDMAYLPDFVRQGDVLRGLSRAHEVGRTLKARGYRYVHIGSWYSGTSACELADTNLHPAQGVLTEFTTALLRMTPLAGLMASVVPDQHASAALFQLDALDRVARHEEADAKFVFAHLLLPHPPLVFDAQGNPSPPAELSHDYLESAKPRFVAQLEFTNDRVLELVDTILERSGSDTIIAIQADEGPWLRGSDREIAWKEQLRIRNGILSAIRLPKAPRSAVSSRMTPVNTFRLIFRWEFGLDLPPLEDRILSWPGARRPIEVDLGEYKFEDVTDTIWEPEF